MMIKCAMTSETPVCNMSDRAVGGGFIILLICLNVAPRRAEAELGLAFKGGPNAATLAADYRFNRYGFSGGFDGYLQRPISDRFLFGAQIELLYSPRGATANFEGEYLGKVRQHYVDVMVEARSAAQFGSVRIYILLGGGLNILMSANVEDASGAERDITDGLRRIDVAALGGAGVALRVPRDLGPLQLGTVFLEARHDIGLIDTDSVVGGFKNRSSSLMLGLSFVVAGRRPPDPPPPPVTAGAAGR